MPIEPPNRQGPPHVHNSNLYSEVDPRTKTERRPLRNAQRPSLAQMTMGRRQALCNPGAPEMLKDRCEALFFETVQCQVPLLCYEPSQRRGLTAI
jgi:hypothetical protein